MAATSDKKRSFSLRLRSLFGINSESSSQQFIDNKISDEYKDIAASAAKKPRIEDSRTPVFLYEAQNGTRPPLLPIVPLQRLRLLREKQRRRELQEHVPTLQVQRKYTQKRNTTLYPNMLTSLPHSRESFSNTPSPVKNTGRPTGYLKLPLSTPQEPKKRRCGTEWSGHFEYDISVKEDDKEPVDSKHYDKLHEKVTSPPRKPRFETKNALEKLSKGQERLLLEGPSTSTSSNTLSKSKVKTLSTHVTPSVKITPTIGFNFGDVSSIKEGTLQPHSSKIKLDLPVGVTTEGKSQFDAFAGSNNHKISDTQGNSSANLFSKVTNGSNKNHESKRTSLSAFEGFNVEKDEHPSIKETTSGSYTTHGGEEKGIKAPAFSFNIQNKLNANLNEQKTGDKEKSQAQDYKQLAHQLPEDITTNNISEEGKKDHGPIFSETLSANHHDDSSKSFAKGSALNSDSNQSSLSFKSAVAQAGDPIPKKRGLDDQRSTNSKPFLPLESAGNGKLSFDFTKKPESLSSAGAKKPEISTFKFNTITESTTCNPDEETKKPTLSFSTNSDDKKIPTLPGLSKPGFSFMKGASDPKTTGIQHGSNKTPFTLNPNVLAQGLTSDKVDQPSLSFPSGSSDSKNLSEKSIEPAFTFGTKNVNTPGQGNTNSDNPLLSKKRAFDFVKAPDVKSSSTTEDSPLLSNNSSNKDASFSFAAKTNDSISQNPISNTAEKPVLSFNFGGAPKANSDKASGNIPFGFSNSQQSSSFSFGGAPSNNNSMFGGSVSNPDGGKIAANTQASFGVGAQVPSNNFVAPQNSGAPAQNSFNSSFGTVQPSTMAQPVHNQLNNHNSGFGQSGTTHTNFSVPQNAVSFAPSATPNLNFGATGGTVLPPSAVFGGAASQPTPPFMANNSQFSITQDPGVGGNLQGQGTNKPRLFARMRQSRRR